MLVPFDAPFTLRARWVLPVEGPPLAGGAVTIHRGRIEAVEKRPSRQVDVDLPDSVLVPGFVNVHTHLEFSDLPAPLGEPGMRFPDWIRLVVGRRRQQAATASSDILAAQRIAAIESGLRECVAAGTTLVGEIASAGWPRTPFAAPPLACVLFQELLGLRSEAIEPQLAVAREHLADTDALQSWLPAISPHAPYTIHPELLTKLVSLAGERHVPVAMHLAESPEELELLDKQSGPFRELLGQFGAWQPDVLRPGMRPLDYLRTLADAESALVIHGNYLTAEEREFLAARRDRMTLVYCPRTHAYFGHAPYPLAAALREGVAVAIGTDSRASNPDLSLLGELRQVARLHPELAPADILRLGTLAGARALGQDHVAGSLVPGKRADLAIVRVEASLADPHEALLAESSRVTHTIICGRNT